MKATILFITSILASTISILHFAIQTHKANNEYNITANGRGYCFINPIRSSEDVSLPWLISELSCKPDDILRRMKSVWRFEIKNEGTKEVSKLSFESPMSGCYRILEMSGMIGIHSSELASFNKTMLLNSLLPNHWIIIEMWSESYEAEIDRNEIRMSHSSGTIPILFPVEVNVVQPFLYKKKPSYYFHSSAFFIIIPLSIIMYKLLKLLIVKICKQYYSGNVE